MNAVKRTGPSIELRDDEDMATREDFSSWEWLVLNVCEVGLACIADTGLALWLGTCLQNEQFILFCRRNLLRAFFLPSK